MEIDLQWIIRFVVLFFLRPINVLSLQYKILLSILKHEMRQSMHFLSFLIPVGWVFLLPPIHTFVKKKKKKKRKRRKRKKKTPHCRGGNAYCNEWTRYRQEKWHLLLVFCFVAMKTADLPFVLSKVSFLVDVSRNKHATEIKRLEE